MTAKAGDRSAAPEGYRPAHVTMYVDDYSAESVIPAFLPVDGRAWNGWALPLFAAEVLAEHHDALRRLFPDAAMLLSFDDLGRASITDAEHPEDGDLVDYRADGLVSIGPAYFVWEEVRPSKEHPRAQQ